MKEQEVLQEYQMGHLKLPNRVVMAPMTRSRADNEQKAPTEDLHVPYYTQRATAGLIITEGLQVSKRGVGYINTPGIHSQEQVNSWKKVTKSVHRAGGRIFAQLWHVGRISHPDFHNGQLPLAPSAINPEAEVLPPMVVKRQLRQKRCLCKKSKKPKKSSYKQLLMQLMRVSTE